MKNKTNNLDSEVAEFAEVNREAIIQLATFAEISQEFTLAFAEINFALDVPLLVQALEEHRRCKDIQFVVIQIDDPELEFVLTAIKEKLQAVTLDPAKKLVLIVVGLERSIGYVDHGKTPGVIANLNFARDLFPRQLPYPIVFVLPDYALTRLARGAHDLWAWTSASVQIRSGRQRIEQVHKQVFGPKHFFSSDAKPVKQERIDLLHRLLTQYQPTLGEPDAELAPLRLNILDELADAYFSLADIQTARHFYAEALNLARSIGKEWTRANVMVGLGRTSAFFNNYAQALTWYEQALAIYKAIDDPIGEANTLRVIGDVLQFLDQLQEALNRYDEALQLFKATSNRLGEANTLLAIGNVLQFLTQSQEALNRYDEALQLHKATGDQLGKANTLLAIGDVLQFLKQSQEALNHYDEALQLYKAMGARLGEANTLKAIGDVLQFLKQSQEALNSYDEALQLFKAMGNRLGEANTLLVIGDVLQFLDQLQEALNQYNEALQLFKATDDRLGEANTLKAIGDAILQQDNLDEEGFNQAWESITTAYDLYGEIGDRYSQARILLTSIAPILLRLEKKEEAIAAITEAAELAVVIGFEPMQQRAADLLKSLEQEQT